MKNITTKFTSIIFISLLASCAFFEKGPINDDSQAIAEYKHGKVTLNQAEYELNKLKADNEKLKNVKFENLTSKQQEAIIKEIVLNEYAYRKAKKMNLDDDKDYQKALRIFETEILKQKLLNRLAQDAKKEENLKAKYQELSEKLKTKKDYKISYIAVDKKSDADSLYEKLTKNPNSFAYYAKKKSVDKETAKNGGDLGFVLESSLPDQVVAAIQGLEKGRVSQVVSVGDKFVLVKFEDVRPAEILPFDQAKDGLARSLSLKAQQDFISNSLDDAKISVIVQ